jgi:N-acetylglutamate synthase-like GNAT family acetyltransferase
VCVRRARPNDAAAIQRLYEALVPNDPNICVDAQWIDQLQADATNFLLVIDVDAQVCGTAFLTICLDPMYGSQPFGVIENFVVAPGMQRRGLGRRLMAAVEDHARAARCTKLMLLSAAVRATAHVFFSANGFDGTKKRGFVKYLNRPASVGAARQA